jgi:hypothetical protein
MSPIALPFPLPRMLKNNMKNYYYPARKLSSIQGTPKHMMVSLHIALRPNKPHSHRQSKKEKKNHDI